MASNRAVDTDGKIPFLELLKKSDFTELGSKEELKAFHRITDKLLFTLVIIDKAITGISVPDESIFYIIKFEVSDGYYVKLPLNETADIFDNKLMAEREVLIIEAKDIYLIPNRVTKEINISTISN